jgi:hypothetical protein
MFRHSNVIRLIVFALIGSPAIISANEISGTYIEARTCQVYTGPCFAMGEVGLAGKHAVMSWCIDKGKHADVDLAGLKVAVVVRSSDTLGHAGLEDARQLKSLIIVDQQATPRQRRALVDFVKCHAGRAGYNVSSVRMAAIDMELDTAELTGSLQAGELVHLKARKARPGDCICSNESAFYPPLAQLEGFVPGVTIEGEVSARGLGSRWSIPDSRTAYLGTFVYESRATNLTERDHQVSLFKDR